MLRRKVEQTLLTWKNTPNRKPLILKGCRQCGKTYSVLEFAKKNYEHTVYLNFLKIRNLSRCFPARWRLTILPCCCPP